MVSKVIPSAAAFAFIRHYEGLRLQAYPDARGFITIGYGHKCTAAANYTKITKAQAEAILVNDVAAAVTAIEKFTYISLNQNQIDALTSLVFNIGAGNYATSTLRKALNLSDFHSAAEQFLVWDKINGEHNHWQALRRLAEHDLFLKEIAHG